jgi:DNA polymerase I-like protein with 3'-5' exonuclease and polymerase domains
MIELTRAPARIMNPGTFRLPGFNGCSYTIGRDHVIDESLRLPDMIAVDIEGAGLTTRARLDVKCVTFGTETNAIIADPREPSQFKLIRDVLNSGRRLIFHNSPFDVPILHAVGLLDLDSCDFVTDTLIYARLAEPDEKTSKGLASAANRHLKMDLQDPLPRILKNLGISRVRWFADFDIDTPNYRHMAASDAILTIQLRPVVRADAYARTTEGHPFVTNGVTGAEADALVEREQILNRDSLRRTCRGFRVDTEYADEYRRTNAGRMTELVGVLEHEGVTPGHSASLTKWLDDRGLIPEDYPRTPKKKEPSGTADNLKRLDHPLARQFVEHKRTEKIDKDYLTKVLEYAEIDGRIHPALNFLGAATGRNSMDNPPVQQFPGPARGIIIPEDFEEVLRLAATYYTNPDHLVSNRGLKTEKVECMCPERKLKGFASIDWSQIEPVLAANVAGDIDVLEGYEAGISDLYTDIARFAHVDRKVAKVILLAQLYGEGLLKLAVDLGLITPAEASKIRAEFLRRKKHNKNCAPDQRMKGSQAAIAEEFGIEGFLRAVEIRDKVFEPIPQTYRYMSLLRDVAAEYQLIPTISGRILPIPAGWYDGEWSVQTHKGINYTFQGGAYDILANTLLEINRAGLRDHVYFPMHDELICDAEAARDIRRIMETPPARLCEIAKRTPVLRTDMAHLGERWYAA